MSEISILEDYLLKTGMTDVVYVHQKDAIEWLYSRLIKNQGALLADDMGLGKTFDICMLLQISLRNLNLIICPTSCLYSQWVRNTCMYCISYQIYVLQSGKIKRVYFLGQNYDKIIEGELFPIEYLYLDPYPYKIIISNFHQIKPENGVVGRDGKKASQIETSAPLDQYIPELTPLNNLQFDVVIVDEVHKIRNGVNTRLDHDGARKKLLMFHRLMRLRMVPTTGVRIGLTGTPIQNRISDVVSILTFLGVNFSPRITDIEVKQYIREYMFRRTANDLHPELRKHINFPIEEYEEIVKNVVYQSQAEADVYRIVAGALTGKNIHNGSELDINGNVDVDRNSRDAINPYCMVQYEPNPLIRTMRECYLSADINMFIDIHNKAYEHIYLPPWPLNATQSKISMIVDDILEFSKKNLSFIVFTHFHAEKQAILTGMYYKAKELGMSSATFDYTIFDINGDIDPKDRDSVILDTQKYIAYGLRCICFCTIQSSSDGINMQHFDTAIFSTSDWNPAMELQAIKRMHRIGQKNLVRIYRYVHQCVIEFEKDVRNHIDVHKLKLQDIKKDKFNSYITNVENAAVDWPIREMPGYPGEASVQFKKFSEPEGLSSSEIKEGESIFSLPIRVNPKGIGFESIFAKSKKPLVGISEKKEPINIDFGDKFVDDFSKIDLKTKTETQSEDDKMRKARLIRFSTPSYKNPLDEEPDNENK